MPNGMDGWRFLPVSHLLRDDLSDLGEPGPHAHDPYPYDLDEARLLGVLYVLEGSSLGAQLLVKQAALLGLSEHNGARHLASQTSDPKRWPAFVKILESNGAASTGDVARGAVDAFAAAVQAFHHDR